MKWNYPEVKTDGEVKVKEQLFSYCLILDQEYLKDFTGDIDEDEETNNVVKPLETEIGADGSLNSKFDSLSI